MTLTTIVIALLILAIIGLTLLLLRAQHKAHKT